MIEHAFGSASDAQMPDVLAQIVRSIQNAYAKPNKTGSIQT